MYYVRIMRDLHERTGGREGRGKCRGSLRKGKGTTSRPAKTFGFKGKGLIRGEGSDQGLGYTSWAIGVAKKKGEGDELKLPF